LTRLNRTLPSIREYSMKWEQWSLRSPLDPCLWWTEGQEVAWGVQSRVYYITKPRTATLKILHSFFYKC
jgi:hypothetical protein